MSQVKGRGKSKPPKKQEPIVESKEETVEEKQNEPKVEPENEPEIDDVSHITEEYMELMKAQMSNLAKNPQLLNAIEKVDMACTRENLGCKWRGRLKEFSQHFDEECDYIVKLCGLNCDAKLYKFKLSTHEATLCPLRIIACARCNLKMIAKDEESHKEVCPKFLLPCPNTCDPKLLLCRDAVEEHRRDCSAQIHQCQFRQFGCTFEGVPLAIENHKKEMAMDHFEMLHQHVSRKQNDVISRIERIEYEREEALTFHGRLLTMENIYGPQFAWLITEFQSKMDSAKSEEKTTFYSPVFSIGRNGYKMILSLSPYGDGKFRGKYMAVYVSICRGPFDKLLPWPFQCPIKITLIDQMDTSTDDAEEGKPQHIEQTIKPKVCPDNMQFLGCPTGERNPGFGKTKFMDLSLLEVYSFVRDDVMLLKLDVDIAGLKMF